MPKSFVRNTRQPCSSAGETDLPTMTQSVGVIGADRDDAPRGWLHFCKPLLELSEQCRQGVWLLLRGDVTAGQALDLKPEFAQAPSREVNLPMFKRIFVVAAYEKRKLAAISLEETTEVESIALCFVISYESRCGGEIEKTIVAIHRVIQFAHFGICHVITFGSYHTGHHLERRKGAPHTERGPVREKAQNWRGVPGMGMTIREESSIEDKNASNVWSAHKFAPLGALN